MGWNIAAVVLVCAAFAAADFTIDDCPRSLPRDRSLRVFQNRCYTFLLSHQRDFHTAERECEARNGHVVIVRDAATQNFLYTTMKNDFHFRGILWIGLSDEKQEGHWVWADGSPAHYTNWYSGQPGLLGFAEDCAAMEMNHNGKWGDYRCDTILFIHSQHYFACEYPITATTPAFTTGTTRPPAISTMADTPASISASSSGASAKVTTALPTTAPPATTISTTPQPATTVAATVATSPVPAVKTTAAPVVTTSSAPATSTTPFTETDAPNSGSDCPPFVCGLDCGLTGNKISPEGCMLCECE